MTPTGIREAIVAEKAGWIRKMLEGIRGLPLKSYEEFMEDSRNLPSAESYLRRALEALLDLGRHILAKGFAISVVEYKQIGAELTNVGILSLEEGRLLKTLAGYRNRLVHFYHEIGPEELYNICSNQLHDITKVLNNILAWIETHPEKIDRQL